MKLTPQIVDVLENFESINKSIVINPGKVIRTMSDTESILAEARIEEEFPRKFAIYDLGRFMSIVKMSKTPELEFTDTFMYVKHGSSKVRVAYSDPKLIVSPSENDSIEVTGDVKFELTPDMLERTSKALQVLKHTTMAIVGKDGKLELQVLSVKDANAPAFSIEVGEVDKNFIGYIEADKLKIIPAKYDVTVSFQGISHFHSESVDYWIALSSNSVFPS